MVIKKLIIFTRESLSTAKTPGLAIQSPKDQQLLPNVAQKLRDHRLRSWKMAIIQSRRSMIVNDSAGEIRYIRRTTDEMRFCLELTGIKRGVFCPDEAGYSLYQVTPDDVYYRSLGCYECSEFARFRLPEPGMLTWFMAADRYDQILLVGREPEDETAAIAAGIGFEYAKTFMGWEN